jgi:hypothetical protein
MAKAFLEMPVGEIEAAAEGRRPAGEEKTLTVRDAGRRDDPDFDRKFAQQIAEARPIIRQSMSAFAKTLPAITKSLSEAAAEIERATANLPRPVSQQR